MPMCVKGSATWTKPTMRCREHADARQRSIPVEQKQIETNDYVFGTPMGRINDQGRKSGVHRSNVVASARVEATIRPYPVPKPSPRSPHRSNPRADEAKQYTPTLRLAIPSGVLGLH